MVTKEPMTIEEEMIRDEIMQEFYNAKTKGDIAKIWRKYYPNYGHRLLGRLLVQAVK